MKVGKKELTIIPRWITVNVLLIGAKRFRNRNVIISNSKIRSTRKKEAGPIFNALLALQISFNECNSFAEIKESGVQLLCNINANAF